MWQICLPKTCNNHQQLHIGPLFQRHVVIKANVIPKKTVDHPSRSTTAMKILSAVALK